MKKFWFLSLLIVTCLIPHHSDGQENISISTGLDFLVPVDFEADSYQHMPGAGIFIEKPFLLNYSDRITLSPAISYKSFRVKYNSGGLGAGYNSDLNHNTLNGYLKWTYNLNNPRTNSVRWYIGALAGIHLVTWQKGTVSSYHMSYKEENWTDPDYKESPSWFFNSLYPGLLTGVVLRKASVFVPSLELKFLPHFGNNSNQAINALELAVKLGFYRESSEE